MSKKIRVTYTDGTKETFDTLLAAEEGIRETVTGCDFAANVQEIEEINKGTTRRIGCEWKVELAYLD